MKFIGELTCGARVAAKSDFISGKIPTTPGVRSLADMLPEELCEMRLISEAARQGNIAQ
jgi:hypothetical protein